MNRRLIWRSSAAAAAAVIALFTLVSAALAHERRTIGDYQLVVGFLNEPAIEGEPNGATLRIRTAAPAATSSETPSGAMDVNMHGVVFNQVIQPGAQYDFTAEHELEDIPVPFHVHPKDFAGTLNVSHDAPAAASVNVEIKDNGFDPSDVDVRADTVIHFMNKTSQAVTLMSGNMSDAPAGTPTPAPVTGIAANLQLEVTHVATGTKKTMTVREAFGDPGLYVSNFTPTAPGVYRFHYTGDIGGTRLDETFESSPTTFNEVQPAKDVQFPVQLASSRELEGALRGTQTDLTSVDDAASSARTIAIIGVVVGALGLAAGGTGTMLAMRKK